VATLPADAVSAAARFVLLRDLPLLVVDLTPPQEAADEPPALREGLFRTLLERGLVQLPRFYDVDLPKGVRVGLTLEPERLRLEDDQETTLLRVPRAGVDTDWVDRALALRGTMLCVGPGLGIGPDHEPHEVCDLLDLAATDGRVAGAIVGVAEPAQGLPLLFT
jgi:hypothetical protein